MEITSGDEIVKMHDNSRQRHEILSNIKLTLDKLDRRNKRSLYNPAEKNVDSLDIKHFKNRIIEASATISILGDSSDIPHEVTRFINTENITSPITITDPALLNTINWHGININHTYDPDNIMVGVTHACMGIEETGSLVMKSSAANPTGLNFLPDYHIVILDKNTIVKNLNQVWKQLGNHNLPRTVNIITGPSRTADIEHTIQLGAHGPRRLHIIVI